MASETNPETQPRCRLTAGNIRYRVNSQKNFGPRNYSVGTYEVSVYCEYKSCKFRPREIEVTTPPTFMESINDAEKVARLEARIEGAIGQTIEHLKPTNCPRFKDFIQGKLF
jgi:hypothetical protein